MPKRKLIEIFQPKTYELYISNSGSGLSGKVIIEGRKVGRPSKRLTLHQRKLKLTSSKLTKLDKNGERLIPIGRINRHDSFEELRLHGDEMLWPGDYRLELEFTTTNNDKAALDLLAAGQWTSARHIFPLIDEIEAEAVYNVHYAKS